MINWMKFGNLRHSVVLAACSSFALCREDFWECWNLTLSNEVLAAIHWLTNGRYGRGWVICTRTLSISEALKLKDKRSLQFRTDADFSATSFPGFSPTRPTERERERPWKTLVTWLWNKINSEGGVPCLTLFLSGLFPNVHADRNSKVDLLTLLQL